MCHRVCLELVCSSLVVGVVCFMFRRGGTRVKYVTALSVLHIQGVRQPGGLDLKEGGAVVGREILCLFMQ